VCALLSGLVVACDYSNGQALLEAKDFSEFRSFFRHVFETVQALLFGQHLEAVRVRWF
jgi:hypothetical protein